MSYIHREGYPACQIVRMGYILGHKPVLSRERWWERYRVSRSLGWEHLTRGEAETSSLANPGFSINLASICNSSLKKTDFWLVEIASGGRKMRLGVCSIWVFVLCVICFNGVFTKGKRAVTASAGDVSEFDTAEAKSRRPHCKGSNPVRFNVKSFGARADGHTDDSRAFEVAWKQACETTGLVKLLIPRGTYLVGPIKFTGPCRNVSSITIHLQGYLKATTNLSKYKSGGGWIEFGWIEGLTLTGGGIFDGQGAKAWPYNRCTTDYNCKLLPTNVKFVAMNRTVVRGITSLNSKFFHIALVECKNFKGSKIRIAAPGDSPNTDGIHIERSSDIYISRSQIGTGDDCISIGQGNSHVTITGISCGPGHGISVGSLGKYQNEGDVRGLTVRDSIITSTTNGIRIKTWANSPGSSAATNMMFENIVMNNVSNPIIIDQAYCPFTSCPTHPPSKVELSDIYFKKIRGTSSSWVAVVLECSKGIPCKNIYLEDVHLDLSSGEKKHPTSSCKNVEAKYVGTQIPPPCA